MNQPEAQLSVTRNLAIDLQQRQVILSLDGEELATLRYGETVTQPIEPGHHHLRAYNTLVWKSLEFEAKPGEHIRFVTANRAGRGSWIVFILGAGPIYLTLEPEADQPRSIEAKPLRRTV